MNEVKNINTLIRLTEELKELKTRQDERMKAQHARFNVFTTVLKAQDEVRLHTRFLQNLLHPQGTHDCGDLFLRLFLESLNHCLVIGHDNSRVALEWTDYLRKDTTARKEVRTDKGQLDLLIESKSHTLVIENKIYHHEGERQLARYVEYTESFPEGTQSKVLYLTLNGKAATTAEDKEYYRISYQEHILHWLEKCLEATYSVPPINQVLLQYKKVVQQLTNLTFDTTIMSHINSAIHTNPSLIENAHAVLAEWDKIKEEIKGKLPEAFKIELQDDYDVDFRKGMVKEAIQGFIKDDFAGLTLRSKKDDVVKPSQFEIWLELNKENNLTIGIETKWQKGNLNEDEALLLQKINDPLIEAMGQVNIDHDPIRSTWNANEWFIGLFYLKKDFLGSDESYIKMLDQKSFDSAVKEASIGIRHFMKAFTEIYNHQTKN